MKHILLAFFLTFCLAVHARHYQVVVVGGGTSGVCAAVQSARLGAKTLLIDATPWLGGMLTAAGVSATDGCYRLPSGMWGDFQAGLARHYGSMAALQTGWVSMIQFEPSVGNRIFQSWVSAEPDITYRPQTTWKHLRRTSRGWQLIIVHNKEEELISTDYLIDATELGDVAHAAGLPYHVGLDARNDTGEPWAPAEAQPVVQDMTYVMTLKQYDKPQKMTRPEGYDAREFRNCCINSLNDSNLKTKPWTAEVMMHYGRLPNGKYMINWPLSGNDYYLNDIDYTPFQRDSAERKAKEKSLRFLYFMQNELGMHNLGLADEYPTADGLPFFPYYREGRRFTGRVLFTLNDILTPYNRPAPLYRTAVAVGDYPVDQHHNEHPVPDLTLPSIPSWGLPLGVFFPRDDNRLILAEKAVSVTNLVNGTSRLQPVVMQIGQVAGTLAAMAVAQKRLPCHLSVRDVQRQLLKTGNYLLPFLDVPRSDALFPVLQRIGVTGILQGRGRHHDWSNETWFDVDSVVQASDVERLFRFYTASSAISADSVSALIPANLNAETLQQVFARIMKAHRIAGIEHLSTLMHTSLEPYNVPFPAGKISRKMFAIWVDAILNPFAREVDLYGNMVGTSPLS